MRILCVASTQRDPGRGASGCDLATIEALRHRGHVVEEIWGPGLGRRIRHGNLHYLLELPRRFDEAIEERCLGRAFDVVQVSQPQGYLAARRDPLRRRARLYVVRSHGWEPAAMAWRKREPDGRSRWRVAASKLLWLALRRHSQLALRSVDVITVGSRADREYIRTESPGYADRVRVAPPGIHAEFLSAPRSMDVERVHRVIHVAQFDEVKAPRIVAGVFDRLAASNSRIEHSVSFDWGIQSIDI